MTYQVRSRHGFTLVELSIVIVIIGLIIAGVTAGQSLVKQAKLRQVLQDIVQYKTAINSFRLQYNAVPGDFRSASLYWTACVDNGVNNPCNGNGDGLLNNTEGEYYRFWQHLALSGIIPGSYTGVTGALQEGVNMPITPFKGYVYWPRVNLSFIYGKPSLSKNNFHYKDMQDLGVGPLFTPDAYAIDLKGDDGFADKGWIAAEDQPCVTAAYTTARSYALNQTTAKCRMYIYW